MSSASWASSEDSLYFRKQHIIITRVGSPGTPSTNTDVDTEERSPGHRAEISLPLLDAGGFAASAWTPSLPGQENGFFFLNVLQTCDTFKGSLNLFLLSCAGPSWPRQHSPSEPRVPAAPTSSHNLANTTKLLLGAEEAPASEPLSVPAPWAPRLPGSPRHPPAAAGPGRLCRVPGGGVTFPAFRTFVIQLTLVRCHIRIFTANFSGYVFGAREDSWLTRRN